MSEEQEWIVTRTSSENGVDAWAAKRSGVTITGANEEELRTKLKDHLLETHPGSDRCTMRRRWLITVHPAALADDEEDMVVFDLFD
ncbi:hypothetical protein ACK3TF_004585 [Chlorella vulgaris]